MNNHPEAMSAPEHLTERRLAGINQVIEALLMAKLYDEYRDFQDMDRLASVPLSLAHEAWALLQENRQSTLLSDNSANADPRVEFVKHCGDGFVRELAVFEYRSVEEAAAEAARILAARPNQFITSDTDDVLLGARIATTKDGQHYVQWTMTEDIVIGGTLNTLLVDMAQLPEKERSVVEAYRHSMNV